jgi:propanol-preferring alcohol dehydrogenase
MRAYQLTQWQQPAEFRDVLVPEVGPDQVLVKIGGAGACHSDLHVLEWPEGQVPWQLPFTLGHENAGWVEQVGAGVRGLSPGDAVVVYGPWGCGRCKPCRLGRENYCEHAAEILGAGGGLGFDGGLAEYMLVPASRLLIPIGDLDPVEAAPLADAGLTPYHAIKHSLGRLEPGSTAVVIGAGGLGQMAVQLLRALSSAQIVVVDKAAEKRKQAKRAGADEVFVNDQQTRMNIRDLCGGQGAELVLDMVGSNDTLALGAASVRAEGHLTIVGLALGTLPLTFFGVAYGATVRTSYWGTIPELIELVSLARAKKIHTNVEAYPLEKAAQVYEKLAAGKISGRAVLTPNR